MSGKYDAYQEEKDEELLRRLRAGESEIHCLFHVCRALH